MRIHRWLGTLALMSLSFAYAAAAPAETVEASPADEVNPAAVQRAAQTPANVLSAAEWARVDAAVARALAWLAMQQREDGSFPSIDTGQPGVTSLCVLAFMAHGHNPGEGPYGQRLDRAVDYIRACQKENGLITLYGPDGPRITRAVSHGIANTAVYNHAISALTLSEIYGMQQPKQSEPMQQAINRALHATLEMQQWPKDRPCDRGGWRYLDEYDQSDSDLSITGWCLMFLRSARNAGFNVPKSAIDDAVGYIRRNFDRKYGTFGYRTQRDHDQTRAMSGAGILALGHAGFHNSFEAQQAGRWLLRYNFDIYNHNPGFQRDRYHYGLFACCQGMYQLGSPYWEQFFPRTVHAILANQQADGSWDTESHRNDRMFGNSYTTALVILALGAPNQLLPVFQR